MFTSKGWSETYDGCPQCLYENDRNHRFIVRMESEFKWIAISLCLPHFMPGQIIAEGQSDIDCFNKAEDLINP